MGAIFPCLGHILLGFKVRVPPFFWKVGSIYKHVIEHILNEHFENAYGGPKLHRCICFLEIPFQLPTRLNKKNIVS